VRLLWASDSDTHSSGKLQGNMAAHKNTLPVKCAHDIETCVRVCTHMSSGYQCTRTLVRPSGSTRRAITCDTKHTMNVRDNKMDDRMSSCDINTAVWLLGYLQKCNWRLWSSGMWLCTAG